MLATLNLWFARLRRSAFAFPLAVLVAGLMVGISEVAYQQAGSQLRRLVVMGQVRLEVGHVLRRVTDAESGQRGFLLTGQGEYLKPYQSASRDVRLSVDKLQALYGELSDETGLQRVKLLSRQIETKLSELDEVMSIQVSGQKTKAHELVLSGIGRDQMDAIRSLANEMVQEQNNSVAIGLRSVFDTFLLNRVGVASMTAISLLVLAMFLRQSSLLDRQRRLQQDLVRAERDRLEQDVQTRTAELTQLARHLETAREDERARLARDLHDELGALLTAAKLDVTRVRPRLLQAAPDLGPRLAHLVETLNSGIALKRRIIEDLRPSTLDNLGLVASLEVLCREFGERLAVPVHTSFEPVKLTASADLTVFRMVQEALNNIAKYAQPGQVWVTIESLGDEACVTVRDDGDGFDAGRVGSGGQGLVGMRYRVQAEQGQLHLRTQPGEGTSLIAELPQLPAADQGTSPGV